VLSPFASGRRLSAPDLWSVLQEHELLEPAWLDTPSDDYAAANYEFLDKPSGFGEEQRAFEYSETKH
jgi:hypothetical protein